MTAEGERAANRGGPRPGAEGWGGGQPRGTQGTQRGCPGARSPEQTRVKRPALSTEGNVHSDMWRCVRACVRGDRQERTKCTRPGEPCTRGSPGDLRAWRPTHVPRLTADTSGAGARASSRTQSPGMCTPKALFVQEVCMPRTHSQRHTEASTMQLCAQCRYVCALPAAQSGQ